jgi:creatinine deaminase
MFFDVADICRAAPRGRVSPRRDLQAGAPRVSERLDNVPLVTSDASRYVFRRVQHPLRHESFMDSFLQAAIEEAKQGLAEGGIPIGSVLVIDRAIVGRGHNRRVQRGSAILHAEMDCLENCGRLTARDYRRSVLYSTLSPCDMCSGASLLYGIPKIVIGENQTFRGPEQYLRERGVELEVVNDPVCIRLMSDFIAAKPELWNEDIGC